MQAINNFLKSRKKIWIYTVVKLAVVSYIVYLFTITEDFATRIIILAFGFILLMSMVPVWVLHYVEMKKIEKENETQNS